MARIRTLKPDFWKHEALSALDEATLLLAIALLNYSDDEGFFNANPALIKAECSPLREPSRSIQESLSELSNIGYLRLGKGADGRVYGHILNFLSHQRVNRPNPSKIKTLDIDWESSTHTQLTEGSLKTHTQLTHNSHPEKEGNGKRKGIGKKTLRDSDESTPISLKSWFDEIFWSALPTERRKGKSLTWKEIQKLKPNQVTREQIVTYVSSYERIKGTYDAAGEFFAPMADPVRVIKHKRYLDELVPFTGTSRRGGMAKPACEKDGRVPKLNIHLWPPERIREKLKFEGDGFRRKMEAEGLNPADYEEADHADH